MASILNVSYSDKKVTFVNPKTEKAESFAFDAHMETGAALRVVRKEIEGRESVAAATVSLFVDLLDNARLDGYKGMTPINAVIPKELKSAVRDLETDTFRPEFVAMLAKRGATPAKAETDWQAFAAGLRAGGSYAQAKGKIVAYFAHCGKLPCLYVNGQPDKSKLFSVAAIEKLLANAKAENPGEREDTSLAARIVALQVELDARTEKTILTGDTYGLPSAIAALRAMLATFEGLQREAAEFAAEHHAPVTGKADAVISKAKAAKGVAQPA